MTITISLLILAMLFSAIMDTTDRFSEYFKRKEISTNKKIYKFLREWCDSESWRNKYKIKDHLIRIGIPELISSYLSKDVFVVFLDMWHFSKAMMILCFLIPISGKISSSIEVNQILILVGMFTMTGTVFNFFYYRFEKIK